MRKEGPGDASLSSSRTQFLQKMNRSFGAFVRLRRSDGPVGSSGRGRIVPGTVKYCQRQDVTTSQHTAHQHT